MSLCLRPYQEEALRSLEHPECPDKALVQAATGTGKTVIFAEYLRRHPGRSLILAHRDELLTQAREKIGMVWPEHPGIGLVKAESDQHEEGLVLASVQTLARPTRLDRISEGFDTIIVDECHHASAKSYREILEAFYPCTVIGFTATPERNDEKSLGDVFDAIVFRYPILKGIREGYLCDLRGKQVALRGLNLDGVKVSRGDFTEESLGEAMLPAAAQVAEAYVEHGEKRKALFFCPTVAVMHRVAEELTRRGVGTRAVWGEQPLEERRAVLTGFDKGAFQALVNVGVCLEGWDCPSLECVVMARPTKSRVLYQQAIGRGTRLYPGKENCLILDLVGATQRHSLETLAALFSLTEKSTEKGVGAVVAEQERRSREAVEGALGEARAVDLLGRAGFHWLKADETRFCIPAGEETLILRAEGGTWKVLSLGRRERTTRGLQAGLTLEYAQGWAEDYIRNLGATVLAASTARWRGRPASEAQLVGLRKWGISPPPGLLSGGAADLLTLAVVRARA